jgi:hypothetical protein
MADIATEIDLDSVIDRLLEGELARHFFFSFFSSGICGRGLSWRLWMGAV